MNLYPRSFLSMLVLGNIVVILPLIAAVVLAAVTVDDLTRSSEAAVRETARVATLGRALREEQTHMNWLLRQFQALNDPSLLSEYDNVRRNWRRDAGQYAELPLLQGLTAPIQDMLELEAVAYLGLGRNAEGLAPLRATMGEIMRRSEALQGDANRRIEAEQSSFRIRATSLRHRMMAAVLSALAITALLLWLGRRLVARMWSRFDRAVLSIGDGHLDRRIRLKGPDDLQRVGRRLEWLRRRLQSLESERTRVMRHTSHELRTPLAALHEGVSLLDEGLAGQLTPQQSRIAGIMKGNAVRLHGLIESLLRLQQASHARESRPRDAVRVDRVVADALETYQLVARKRRLNVSASLAALTVQGDHEAIATVVGNLLSNSIKFSPDGRGIEVRLAAAKGFAVLDVIDQGPGVSVHDSERIFTPFFRGKASKDTHGTGLGLAIAREFAIAHGGTIEILPVASGAHFQARLPLASATTPEARSAPVPIDRRVQAQ